VSLALALLLAVGPARVAPWQPAPAPPPTPWARAGARGWAACEDLGRQAAGLRGGTAPRADPGTEEPSVWIERAQRCPAVPDVIVYAAQLELANAGDVGAVLEPDASLGSVVTDHRSRIERALGWLDHALEECARRRETPPRETRFLRAYALVTLGRASEAEVALTKASAAAEVEGWRVARMGAAIALIRGDLERAMALAHRAFIDAPLEDRTITRYIRALVLDRSGAIAAARTELGELRADAGHVIGRRATESLLPVHERLYLRALDDQVGGEDTSALRLWDAYLSRPEPEEPERVLARRHRAELQPRGAPVR
jgi:hypothetical protein